MNYKCQFVSIYEGVIYLLGLRILEINGFQHAPTTCFCIFCLNCVHDFILSTWYLVRVSSHYVDFWRGYDSLKLELSIMQFLEFFFCILWRIELTFSIWLYSYIVSVNIQCQAFIYTLSLCLGHSWRERLAKQETLTPPGHLVSPLVCRGPWISTLVLYCWCHSDSASVLLYIFYICLNNATLHQFLLQLYRFLNLESRNTAFHTFLP